MDINKLQEEVFRRNNFRFKSFKNKKRVNFTKNNNKNDWKELYQGFNSAIERDNT